MPYGAVSSMLASAMSPTQPQRRRIVLMTNDLLSTYQVAFGAAVERAVHAKGWDFMTMVGRELGHPDPNERVQNQVYEWLSDSAASGVVLLSGVLANFAGTEALVDLRSRLAPLPVVSIGVQAPEVPSLVVDNRVGTRHAVEHLIVEHGCRRIAYIAGPPTNQEACARLQGYHEALQEQGLPRDESLVLYGGFTSPTGRECVRELLRRQVVFDAVAAANDYMAMGAMDALREQRIRVPEEVRIVGFDDSPVARFASRSLTTVAQPIDRMVANAISLLEALFRGEEVPPTIAHHPNLELRESCGCAHEPTRRSLVAEAPSQSPGEYLAESRAHLRALLGELCQSAGEDWSDRVEAVLDAFAEELRDQRGDFAVEVETITEATAKGGGSVERMGRVLLALQRHFDAAGYGESEHPELERIFRQALSVVSTATIRAEGRRGLDLLERFVRLRYATQRVSIALESGSMVDELVQNLPSVGVTSVLVALISPERAGCFRPILVLGTDGACRRSGDEYPLAQLLPAGYPSDDTRSLCVMPVSFEADVLGVIAFDGATDMLVCENIRLQVGAALKLGAFHRRVVEETAARERLARTQFEGEMAVARRIQTALAPKTLEVLALKVAACVVAADQVGGDYYDVIPVRGGCWIAIGDVTGHGLLAGLIMLMLQSIVGTLTRVRPEASPAEIVVDVNRGFAPNVRERLEKNDFATFALLRFFDDGRVVFAGNHELILVCRAATGICERIPTSGMWLGVADDIAEYTTNREFVLRPGDLLVLYTDGLVEARNAKNEQLGLDRVCGIVEARVAESPETIRDALVSAGRSWAPVQQDDVTCIVARYEPASA